MSVTSTTYSVAYTSNGVTTTFNIPFYFMATTDIFVAVTVSGVTVTAVNGVDYTVGGTPNSYGAFPSGGTITFQVGSQWAGPPPNLATITIIRMTARLQPDTYLDNSAFPATVNESDLDRLTLISQEASQGLSGFLGILAGIPTSGTFIAGNWFIYAVPTAGQFFGAICVTGGSPGTWKTFGAISA